MITIPVIDWNDPCGALLILRPLWLQANLETGPGVTRVRFRTANSEREVQYSTGSRDDLARLGKVIAMLEYQCGLITNMPARRVTIAG